MNSSQYNLSSFSLNDLKENNTVTAKEFLYCADKCVKVEEKNWIRTEKYCLNNCFNLISGSKLDLN